jgi:hypothetical protein
LAIEDHLDPWPPRAPPLSESADCRFTFHAGKRVHISSPHLRIYIHTLTTVHIHHVLLCLVPGIHVRVLTRALPRGVPRLQTIVGESSIARDSGQLGAPCAAWAQEIIDNQLSSGERLSMHCMHAPRLKHVCQLIPPDVRLRLPPGNPKPYLRPPHEFTLASPVRTPVVSIMNVVSEGYQTILGARCLINSALGSQKGVMSDR